jgi:hypothetical protein
LVAVNALDALEELGDHGLGTVGRTLCLAARGARCQRQQSGRAQPGAKLRVPGSGGATSLHTAECRRSAGALTSSPNLALNGSPSVRFHS